MISHTPFVIFSAELASWSPAVNASRTEFLKRQLEARGLDFAPVLGSYKGVKEHSFIVLAPESSSAFDQCVSIARHWGQESILSVDANRHATLVYLSATGAEGSPIARLESIGTFRAVSSTEAAQLDGWTQDEHGAFYAVA